MRFLVESGTYAIDNLGDIAMLQRTVERLRAADPVAEIAVVTERPDRLKEVLPEVKAVPAGPWFRLRVMPVPKWLEYTPLVRRIRWREKLLAGRLPRVARLGKRWDRWASVSERKAADAFFEEVRSSDAVVAAGGGYINDHYHEHAWKVLATLNLAQGLGKPTAMFGIGLGPVSRDDLKWHGGSVLRRLDLLALREADLGPGEARRLDVPETTIVVTGDDAVALAATVAPASPEARHHLGVNLRLAPDAEVPVEAIPRVRKAVEKVARERGASPVPLIIRTIESPGNDVEAARRIFGEDGIDLSRANRIKTPADGFAEIARCRVVITGAYHNAVFALAMGVPVVGLGQSAYYLSKLEGVADQFGAGMKVLRLDDPDLEARLTYEVNDLWDKAGLLDPKLRAAAARQVARSEAAYHRFLQRVSESTAGRTL